MLTCIRAIILFRHYLWKKPVWCISIGSSNVQKSNFDQLSRLRQVSSMLAWPIVAFCKLRSCNSKWDYNALHVHDSIHWIDNFFQRKPGSTESKHDDFGILQVPESKCLFSCVLCVCDLVCFCVLYLYDFLTRYSK